MKVPRLDYVEALRDSASAAAAFKAAMEEPGFLFVANVPGYDARELERWTRWFFDLPEETKMRLRTNPYRGYVPADKAAESSYKELYEIGGLDQSEEDKYILYDATPFPDEEPAFKAFVRRHYSLMQEVGVNLLRMLVPEQESELVRHFQSTPFSTFRLIHYPKRTGPHPDALIQDGTNLHCQDHTDSGFMTLLATFHQAGLEMLVEEEGEGRRYEPVEMAEDGLFVNVGDLMVSLLGGDVKATRHRVVDHGVQRWSAPFFLEPDASCPVKTATNAEPKPYGVFVLEKCTKFFEHKRLLGRVQRDPRYRDLPAFRDARPMA